MWCEESGRRAAQPRAMSFRERDYSLLAVSISKSREDKLRDDKNKFACGTSSGSSSPGMLAKKMMTKIVSILRTRPRYSRRKATMVFNYSAYNPHGDEHQQRMHASAEPPSILSRS